MSHNQLSAQTPVPASVDASDTDGSTDMPFVSVLVPVRNEERFLTATLDQLLYQDYPTDRYEVIVADGCSTDRTVEIVHERQQEAPHLTLVENPGRWSSAGRNAALRAARGEYLVVVDGHCQLDSRNYLRRLVSAFERSGAETLGRPQPQQVDQSSLLQQAIAAARESWLGHHSSSFIYSGTEQIVPPQSVAVAYRRKVFEHLGGFDPNFDACEDVEFNHRVAAAGYRCFFTPTIEARYFPRQSLRGLFRQLSRYGRGRVRLWRKHPETFSLSSFVPAAFLLFAVILGPLAALINSSLALGYGAVIGIYFSVVLLVSATVALRHRRAILFCWLPAVFATIHAAAGYGVLVEALCGPKQSPQQSDTPLSLQVGSR